MKKAFLIIFKELSLKQIKQILLEDESTTLSLKSKFVGILAIEAIFKNIFTELGLSSVLPLKNYILP